MKQQLQDPVFIVFSNDISWCEKSLPLENAIYVSWNTGRNSYMDMQLMSCCRHHVIANSSFSWWGAWLNNHEQKKVIAPDKWIRSEEHTSELQSLMRTSYAVFCLKKTTKKNKT